MFVAIGGANLIGFPSFAWLFGKSGEELTNRLRKVLFSDVLKYK